MQRMDSLDSPKNKIVFKKRSHRPWSPTFQENMSENLNPINPESSHLEFSSIALQQTTPERTLESVETNEKFSNVDLNRLLIGGFSFPNSLLTPSETEKFQKSNALMDEIKNKEQEIQTLSNNLKIASALEHAEKIELSRKKEALARKAAEEKALFAMQKVNLIEAELQKSKQQIQIEQQLKIKEESIRKSLEAEIKNTLRAIEDNEYAIAREIEARQIAEEKLNETLRFISEKEHGIRLEAEKTIRDNLRDFIEREKNIEQAAEDRISTLQDQHREQTQKIQAEAIQKIAEVEEKSARKIAEFEEKAHFHEKAKIEAQKWIQKSQEATRHVEIQKNEMEKNLAAAIQNTADQRLHYEEEINNLHGQICRLDEKINGMAIINVELKQQLSEALSQLNTSKEAENNAAKKIDALNLQVQQLTEKSATLETERTELTKLFTDTLGKSKAFQAIANNERQLRTILEKKLSGSELRKMELNKKLFENKILELAEKIGALEIEKAQADEKHHDALEHIHKVEILMASDKAIKQSLEEKNKALTEQIYSLEYAKQKEIDEKTSAEYQVSVLVAQQQRLEQEKLIIVENYNKTMMHANELEITLGTEKSALANLEKTMSVLMKQQQHLEHEKLSIEEKYNAILTHASELEFILGNERDARLSLEKKVETLLHQQHNLEKEKSTIEEKYNEIITKAAELKLMLESEKSLRKDAERLKTIEEQARKAVQEKISSAMEQANKTVLTVLGNYTTTDVPNAET